MSVTWQFVHRYKQIQKVSQPCFSDGETRSFPLCDRHSSVLQLIAYFLGVT